MDKQIVGNLLRIVHDNYNEIATDFNLTRKKEIWPEIIKLAEGIKDGSSILDLGCGNGRLIEALKDKKVKYLGIDNSEELIKLAKVNYPDYKFLVADILNFSEAINEEKFDYIFCLATIQHLPGKNLRVQALKGIKNVLADGGEIVISNWNMWTQKKYRVMIFKNFLNILLGKSKLEFGDVLFPWKNSRGEVVSERYYHAFRKRELFNLAKEVGFGDTHIYKDRFNYWMVLKK